MPRESSNEEEQRKASNIITPMSNSGNITYTEPISVLPLQHTLQHFRVYSCLLVYMTFFTLR